MLDSMTHEERERAEWATGEAGRGRFYCEGYEAGLADVDEVVADAEADAYVRGYDDGYDDGAENRPKLD
jgi:hypothetical protein